MICNTTRYGCAYASAPNAMSNAMSNAMQPSRMVCDNADVVVPAGEARTQPCDDFSMVQPRLAQIQFPIQQYQSGFCPCEALETGTLFPELVS